MVSEQGKQALHQIRGWLETLTDRNKPVYEPTIQQYNEALEVLSTDAGIDLPRFVIGIHELMSFQGRRRYVVWDVFIPRVTAVLSYVEERIATAPRELGPPALPREALRPVLRRLVDVHYQRPPTPSRGFRFSRTENGLVLYHLEDGGSQILELAWGQVNEFQDEGFVRLLKGHTGQEFIYIEDAGMDAYREMVRLDEADRPEGQPIERRAPMNNKVWVIHGHDYRARDVIFALLTAVGLEPLEFDQAAELTRKPSPSIMEILRAAFQEGQAFVALLTPDEEAVPSAAFSDTDDLGPHPQPRPNVVLEAGMAFAYDPDRTVIVEMGRIREISDLAGIHTVKWRQDRYETRKALLRKLRLAKCPVNDTGDHWVRAGGTYP